MDGDGLLNAGRETLKDLVAKHRANLVKLGVSGDDLERRIAEYARSLGGHVDQVTGAMDGVSDGAVLRGLLG